MLLPTEPIAVKAKIDDVLSPCSLSLLLAFLEPQILDEGFLALSRIFGDHHTSVTVACRLIPSSRD